jgi:hypothetical protein|tara:strand:- start:117 stop:1250 length:1134 start_codon:yes stop_codon:yes gene_type:complete
MKRIINIFFFSVISAAALFISSCTTDFELNAEYDEIPVIFGILDQSVDTQFVKINKSFIGNGNNTSYAAINDSSLYTNVIGRVEEYVDGALTEAFMLEEMWVNNLEEGIFYTDSQKVFFFIPSDLTEPYLNEDATYKLIVDVSEEAQPIEAETNLIKGSELNWDLLTSNGAAYNGIILADASTLSQNDYLTSSPKCTPGGNADKYEFKLRLHFKEVTFAGVSTAKYVEWNLGEVIVINGNLKKEISGEAFYSAISNKLSNYSYEADVYKRVISNDNIEIIVTAANENLSLFIGINEPSTGVVTEQPVFTNVEGGVGIFASRFSRNLYSYLNVHSSNVLCAGPATSAYKFCIDPVWDGGGTATGGHNILVTYPGIACP